MSKPAVHNFVQALIAVLAGNIVYFLLLPHLPPAAQHVPMHLDLGTILDFSLCLVFFGITKAIANRKRTSPPR